MELLHRDPSCPQWTRAKSLDGFGAFGPWIDTAFDPGSATLSTRVAGRERQNCALADMFFAPQDLVWRLSQDMTLSQGPRPLAQAAFLACPLHQPLALTARPANSGQGPLASPALPPNSAQLLHDWPAV